MVGPSSWMTQKELIASGLLWPGHLFSFSFLLHYEDPNTLRWKTIGQTYQWSIPENWITCSDHFTPGFSPGFKCQKTGNTGLQPLCHSILLIFKCPALFISRTYYFHLYKYWFQPSMAPDMNICSIPLFQFPQKRSSSFQSTIGSFWAVSYLWGDPCVEITAPLTNFEIFLSIILWSVE